MPTPATGTTTPNRKVTLPFCAGITDQHHELTFQNLPLCISGATRDTTTPSTHSHRTDDHPLLDAKPPPVTSLTTTPTQGAVHPPYTRPPDSDPPLPGDQTRASGAPSPVIGMPSLGTGTRAYQQRRHGAWASTSPTPVYRVLLTCSTRTLASAPPAPSPTAPDFQHSLDPRAGGQNAGNTPPTAHDAGDPDRAQGGPHSREPRTPPLAPPTPPLLSKVRRSTGNC